MAVKKFTSWSGQHILGIDMTGDGSGGMLNEGVVLLTNYDVYADMANGNTQPYLRLNGCKFRHLSQNDTLIKSLLPFTVKISIGEEETVYTFRSGSTVKTTSNYMIDDDTGLMYNLYTVSFSSTTNVKLPKNGEEFEIHITVTAADDQEAEITEHACSPMSNTITGGKTINTGEVATFTLSNAVRNDAQHKVIATMDYYFPSETSKFHTITAYTSEYCRIDYERNSFTEFSFVPTRFNAAIGEKAVANKNGHNIITFSCYYYTMDDDFGADAISGVTVAGASNNTNCILISTITIGINVVAAEGIDSSLAPVFSHDAKINAPEFAQHVLRYGGAVQNQTGYQICVYYEGAVDSTETRTPYPPYYTMPEGLKYGSRFTNYSITFDIDGISETENGIISVSKPRFLTEAKILTEAGHYTVTLTLTDSYGFTSTWSEQFDVLPYNDPEFTVYMARRCDDVFGSGEDGDYYYEGRAYRPSDTGEYVLIEWGVRITPLEGVNSRSLAIVEPPSGGGAGSQTRTVRLPAYLCSGFYVTPADPERSYDIVFRLTDDFHGTGKNIIRTYPLNTVLTAIDFLHGGDGVALGKVAEERMTLDIHRNWTLQMPYDTMIQNYNTNGTAVRLYDWMQQTASRIQAIIDSRDVAVYYRHKFYDGNSAVCIPEGYGQIFDTSSYYKMCLVPEPDRSAALKFALPITISRNYLNIKLDYTESFANQGWATSSAKYRPAIYLMSTEPTTVNQDNSVPVGTIVASLQLHGNIPRAGSISDGYEYWTVYGSNLYYTFNVTSYRGQSLWLVLTCTQGGESQSGYYKYRGAVLNLDYVMLSNTPHTT